MANATEGAAPNKPAKLFGRNTSPSTANAETISLPKTPATTWQKALRAADKAAGSKNVVNELKIKKDDELNATGG